MALLRELGKAIGGLVFSTMLATAIIAIGLAQFTDYDNMNSVFLDIMGPQLQQIQTESNIDIDQIYQYALILCEGKDSIEVPITEDGDTVTFDCSDIMSLESEEFELNIRDIAVTAFFENLYYKDHGCEFLECLNSGNFEVVLSSESHEFFVGIQQLLFFGVIVGAVLILLSAESWPSRLKGLGIPMMFVGVSYFFIRYMKEFMVSKISSDLPAEIAEAGISLSPIIEKIIGPMTNSLLIVFVAGLMLTLAGFGLVLYEKKYGNSKPVKKSEAK